MLSSNLRTFICSGPVSARFPEGLCTKSHKVVPKKVLWGQCIYYMSTWTLNPKPPNLNPGPLGKGSNSPNV